MKVLILSLLLIAVIQATSPAYNGLGEKPQMGWNSWNKFACDVNENDIKGAANQIVSLGMDKLGYEYVNVDDCWMTPDRDENSNMITNSSSFPGTMKNLSDYVHGKGLKFGLYSSAGTMTCQQKAGSLNYEQVDADQWASWGVDYLKYDNCNNVNISGEARYTSMQIALNNTKRPIFYSICNWGRENSPEWASKISNSWRTTDDIADNFASMKTNFLTNQMAREFSGPGHWNDPDMLEIGNGGMSNDEEMTHFALWAIAKAPLIIGCDLTSISNTSKAILTNQNLIDVNQNALAQGETIVGQHNENSSAYKTNFDNGDVAVVVVNWGTENLTNFTFTLEDVGYISNGNVQLKDLWTNEVTSLDLNGNNTNITQITIKTTPSHGCQAFRIMSGSPKTTNAIAWYYFVGAGVIIVLAIIVVAAIIFGRKNNLETDDDLKTYATSGEYISNVDKDDDF